MHSFGYVASNFIDFLQQQNYSKHTIRSYRFTLLNTLAQWLFLNSNCSMINTVSLDSLDYPEYYKTVAGDFCTFLNYAKNLDNVTINEAFKDFCSSDTASCRPPSWLKKIISFSRLYGRNLVEVCPFDSFTFLLNRLLCGERFDFSQGIYSRIIRFLKHVHTQNIFKFNLTWEKGESWRKTVSNVLLDSENITICSNSSSHELMLAYLNHCHYEKELSYRSIYHEMRYLKYFFDWCNSFSLDSFSKTLVKSYVDYLVDKNLKMSSIYHHFNAVKYFADFLLEYELVDSNPARGISLKTRQRKPKEVLSLEERNQLLCAPLKHLQNQEYSLADNSRASFHAARDLCILYLFATTGIRLLEISSLKRTDVKLDEGIITIHGKGSRVFSDKQRTVFLNDDTSYWLKLYLELRQGFACPWLFITVDGFKLASHNFQAALSKYGKCAGIKKRINPTLMRASFASWMIEKGIDPVALKELLGHESIRTTFGYYVFMKEEHVRETWARCNPLSNILSAKKE